LESTQGKSAFFAPAARRGLRGSVVQMQQQWRQGANVRVAGGIL